MIQENLDLLGFEVKDIVTNFVGVVVSINFDLSGCIQAWVIPKVDKAGKKDEGHFFDTKRLIKQSKKRVQQPTAFVTAEGRIPGGERLPIPDDSRPRS
jgi:hypothetical protein